MARDATRIGARGTLATLVQGRCVVAAENAVSRSAWIDLTQRLQDRRVRRHEKLFGVSDMHPDVRPRDIQRQTVGAKSHDAAKRNGQKSNQSGYRSMGGRSPPA
jgi:hypothetical protein